MAKSYILALISVSLMICPGCAEDGATQTASLKALYLTHSAGFKHEVLPLSRQLLREIAARSGIDVTATEDCSMISREGLKPYDAVVFYTTGELPMTDEQKAALIDFVKSGKGFVGIHSATDTFYKWAEYGEMIGGYFDGHPWHQEVTVKVEDRQHPAARHLGESFKIAGYRLGRSGKAGCASRR
jgi:type 1 glutamine amidotransferase